jgi:DNA-binding CsgD family transcriptional regulator
MNSRAPTTGGAPWGERPPLDAVSAVETLFFDAGAFVFAFSATGEIVNANAPGEALYAEASPNPVGKTLRDVFGPEFAEEREQLIARALEADQVVRLLGMTCGVLLSETYRPAREAGRDDLVLMVAHAACLEGDFPSLRVAAERLFAKTHHLGRLSVLTERELELMHHISLGRSSETIAQIMHRSTRTVEWHRASLGQKLGCENRVQLARIAVRAGLNALDIPAVRTLHRSMVRHHPTR